MKTIAILALICATSLFSACGAKAEELTQKVPFQIVGVKVEGADKNLEKFIKGALQGALIPKGVSVAPLSANAVTLLVTYEEISRPEGSERPRNPIGPDSIRISVDGVNYEGGNSLISAVEASFERVRVLVPTEIPVCCVVGDMIREAVTIIAGDFQAQLAAQHKFFNGPLAPIVASK